MEKWSWKLKFFLARDLFTVVPYCEIVHPEGNGEEGQPDQAMADQTRQIDMTRELLKISNFALMVLAAIRKADRNRGWGRYVYIRKE